MRILEVYREDYRPGLPKSMVVEEHKNDHLEVNWASARLCGVHRIVIVVNDGGCFCFFSHHFYLFRSFLVDGAGRVCRWSRKRLQATITWRWGVRDATQSNRQLWRIRQRLSDELFRIWNRSSNRFLRCYAGLGKSVISRIEIFPILVNPSR